MKRATVGLRGNSMDSRKKAKRGGYILGIGRKRGRRSQTAGLTIKERSPQM